MATTSQDYRQHVVAATDLLSGLADFLRDPPDPDSRKWEIMVETHRLGMQAAVVHATLAQAAATLNQTHVLQILQARI